MFLEYNPLSSSLIKWSNTLKQFVGKLPTNCLSVFHHFVGLARNGSTLSKSIKEILVKHIESSSFLAEIHVVRDLSATSLTVSDVFPAIL